MDVQATEDFQRFIQAQLANGRYASEEEAMRDLQQWLRERLRQGEAAGFQGQHTGETVPSAEAPSHFLEVIDELMKDVPEEELAKLPTDGAKNLDHYLYGARKR